MRRVLAISYSQSGQSARALRTFLESLPPREKVEVVRQIDLAEEPAVRAHYHMPWRFFDFVRAQPEAFNPDMVIEASKKIAPEEFDTLVISYPVWFLSPATPVSAFLLGLPPGALKGKDVVTIATCRNMWLEAQNALRRRIETLGGRVITHITLEDTAPTYATLVTTPRFFLSGKKGFESPLMKKLFPAFGVAETEYKALADWAGAFGAEGRAVPESRFRFKSSLALAEVVGRRISLAIYTGWPLVRNGWKLFQLLYLLLAALLTVALIMVLMPPAAILGKLPPLRGLLARIPSRLVSPPKLLEQS